MTVFHLSATSLSPSHTCFCGHTQSLILEIHTHIPRHPPTHTRTHTHTHTHTQSAGTLHSVNHYHYQVLKRRDINAGDSSITTTPLMSSSCCQKSFEKKKKRCKTFWPPVRFGSTQLKLLCTFLNMSKKKMNIGIQVFTTATEGSVTSELKPAKTNKRLLLLESKVKASVWKWEDGCL